jgi:hypothetical protein
MPRITLTAIAAGMNSARNFVPPIMHADGDSRVQSPMQIEIAARSAFERRADRALTDIEWALTRVRLVEFVGILRCWHEKKSRRDNLEVLCKPKS